MLFVGTDKREIVRDLPEPFLIVDDGPLIDALTLPRNRKITRLNLERDSFNPLNGIDYKRARDFLSVLNSVFPEGENTLTRKASNFVMLQALTAHPTRLDKLIHKPHANENGALDAYQKIQTLLLSPVLYRFLCNAAHTTNFSLDGIVLVRLDRTVLAEFDCFVIANLLISAYKGHVVIPDFGFYGCPFHASLIRQKRLTAGVNFLDETPLRNQLLLIEGKHARHCTAEDAATLASYERLIPGTVAHTDFIQKSVA